MQEENAKRLNDDCAPEDANLVPWTRPCVSCRQGCVTLYGCGSCTLAARFDGKQHPDRLYTAEELSIQKARPKHPKPQHLTDGNIRDTFHDCGHPVNRVYLPAWEAVCRRCQGTGQKVTMVTQGEAARRTERQRRKDAQIHRRLLNLCQPLFDLPRAMRPRCGARTRTGAPCRAHVTGREGNGQRCRNHGGLSTGPQTPEGRQRIADSNRRRALLRAEQGSVHTP